VGIAGIAVHGMTFNVGGVVGISMHSMTSHIGDFTLVCAEEGPSAWRVHEGSGVGQVAAAWATEEGWDELIEDIGAEHVP